MPILVGLAVLFVLFVVFVATRPSELRVTRSRTIDAPPGALFGLINDFHEWVKWSPWEKLDPGMKKAHDGPRSGKGAHYHWTGNDKVGEGAMTITDTTPDARVEIELKFLKPFAATNKTVFKIEAGKAGSKVTWTMEGQKNFFSKAYGVFVDMDKAIGKDFEAGLEAMESTARAPRD